MNCPKCNSSNIQFIKDNSLGLIAINSYEYIELWECKECKDMFYRRVQVNCNQRSFGEWERLGTK